MIVVCKTWKKIQIGRHNGTQKLDWKTRKEINQKGCKWAERSQERTKGKSDLLRHHPCLPIPIRQIVACKQGSAQKWRGKHPTINQKGRNWYQGRKRKLE